MTVPTQAEVVRALPYARRFARALTGSQAAGDALVADALRAGLPEMPARQAFYSAVAAASAIQPGLAGESGLGLRQRQVLLLLALEGLPETEVARVLGMTTEATRDEATASRAALRAAAAADVLVIEDEPIIAMDVRMLVESCGHRVIGMARTEDEAVRMARAHPPTLILADVNLGPGGDGISATARIQQLMRAPVIFVTAYPERLLTAERVEPAFVISKPFEPLALAIATYQAVTHGTVPIG
ncbi:response regulator receiver domain-containing protein [Humitalea rosea]|uniref:Response regulator receiver domain-containing protein n=1 Tax=Humitalea rosea TaxID=990373 RepID=A0A2W7IJG8_9PROT|nr:response regulator [Humitalea rosea]PZW45852.1 response regulator receiver domain-containing protein [Humitalea rosea]